MGAESDGRERAGAAGGRDFASGTPGIKAIPSEITELFPFEAINLLCYIVFISKLRIGKIENDIAIL